MTMREYTPDEEQVREFYVEAAYALGTDPSEGVREFDRLIARIKAEAYADGMRAVASWIDGGTPRAYGFEHPCDPPGTKTLPSDHEEALMGIADATREAAARVEKEAGL